MTIISTTHLSRELPSGATDTNSEITDAVAQASSFVDTYTSDHYYPFEDYSASPLTTNAPDVIVRECLEVAKAMYFQRIAQNSRDGNEIKFWHDLLNEKKTTLREIKVQPVWKEETVQLDSNEAMGLGSRSYGGNWTQVIPQTAQVISQTSQVWTRDDWEIALGGRYSDEFRDRWYLYSQNSAMDGATVRYMQTYRSDGGDYAKYMSAT